MIQATREKTIDNTRSSITLASSTDEPVDAESFADATSSSLAGRSISEAAGCCQLPVQ